MKVYEFISQIQQMLKEGDIFQFSEVIVADKIPPVGEGLEEKVHYNNLDYIVSNNNKMSLQLNAGDWDDEKLEIIRSMHNVPRQTA